MASNTESRVAAQTGFCTRCIELPLFSLRPETAQTGNRLSIYLPRLSPLQNGKCAGATGSTQIVSGTDPQVFDWYASIPRLVSQLFPHLY